MSFRHKQSHSKSDAFISKSRYISTT